MHKRFVIKIIKLYQLYISPVLGSHCRFHPTCSSYFQQAISECGLFWGAYKGIHRLLRCNPFSSGGFDPLVK